MFKILKQKKNQIKNRKIAHKISTYHFMNLMPLSTIFQLYHGGQFYLVEETRVHNVVSSTPCH